MPRNLVLVAVMALALAALAFSLGDGVAAQAACL